MFRCNVCKKIYKRIRFFQEHRAVCEAKQAAIADNSSYLQDVPSNLDMWLALKHYIKRCEALENKISKLEMWTARQKRKIKIIDWLNDNFSSQIPFNKLVSSIKLTQDDLELIIKFNFIDGMARILSRKICGYEENTRPIKAFSQYKNKLFVWSGEFWKVLSDEDMYKMINSVHNKLNPQLLIYQKLNSATVNDHNNNSHWYEIIRKVQGMSESSDITMKKIRSKLHNTLKYNLKKIVEYEFVS